MRSSSERRPRAGRRSAGGEGAGRRAREATLSSAARPPGRCTGPGRVPRRGYELVACSAACRLLPALVAVAATLVAPAPAPAHARRRARRPLTITIDALSPSYIPRKGPIRVVRVDHEPRRRDLVGGQRLLLHRGHADHVVRRAGRGREDRPGRRGRRRGSPRPAPTTPSTGSTPARAPSSPSRCRAASSHVSQPGVYWFGVHALGDDRRGPSRRRRRAGPHVPPAGPAAPGTGRHRPGGAAAPRDHPDRGRPARGRRRLDRHALAGRTAAVAGRLRCRGRVAADHLAGRPRPARRRALARGGQPAPVPGPDRGRRAPARPRARAATSAPGATSDGGTSGEQSVDPAATAAGNAWLGRLHEALGASQILALPYGDLDVAAAAQHDPGLYQRARKRSGSVLAPWGLRMTPAISSPSGYLDAQGMRLADRNTTVLVTDRMFRGDAPPVARTAGTRLVTSSSGAARGGPGPDDAARADGAAPADRSARRRCTCSHRAGRRWSWWSRPTGPRRLDRRVLRGPGRPVAAPHRPERRHAGARARRAPGPADLPRPPGPARAGPSPTSRPREALIRAGATLQNVLTGNDDVASVVADEALTGTVVRQPRSTRRRARRPRTGPRPWIDAAARLDPGVRAARGDPVQQPAGGSPRPSPTASTSR